MKLLTTLALFCAAVSASPLSLPTQQGYDLNLTVHQGHAHDVYEPDLFKRAGVAPDPRKAFKAVQRAAGRTTLHPGKSYYFMTCYRFTKEALDNKARDGGLNSAEKWVQDQTSGSKLGQGSTGQGSPLGCSHVGLLVGTVKGTEKKPGCLTCGGGIDKTFEGTFYDVVYHDKGIGLERHNMWGSRPGVRWAVLEGQVVYYKGEVGKNVNLAQLPQTIGAATEQWMRKSGPRFDVNANCLVYFNAMEPYVRGIAR